MAKSREKLKARSLRRRGMSIKDIAGSLAISKSTVSLWCRDILLSPHHIELLHKKMVVGGYKGRLMGATAQRNKRLERIHFYEQEGLKTIGKITERDLFMAGLGLYMGEGNKGGRHFQFANSNPEFIKVIIRWLRLFGVSRKDCYCNVIINEVHRHRIDEIQKQWGHITKFSPLQFKKPVFIKAVHKKVFENEEHHLGTLILRVYKGSGLLYKVLGLMKGFIQKLHV